MAPVSFALTDEQLVERSRRGDREAFGELVERYQKLVLQVAYQTGADVEMAQDVAQDVFLRAWQALPGFEMRHQASFRSWICRIASNRTVDLLRCEARLAALKGPGPMVFAGPEEAHERQELADVVRQALLRLPEQSRQALVLREYGQLSYREISEALGIPIGTVMSRLHYARNWLRRELAPFVRSESEGMRHG